MVFSKEIILHIGLHKTGTTSYQKFLEKNSKVLLNHGIKVYENQSFNLSSKVGNCLCCALDISSICLRKGVRYEADIYRDSLKRPVERYLKKILDDPTYNKLVISSEDLSLFREDNEFRNLIELFERNKGLLRLSYKVLLILRDKEDWWQSYLNNFRSPRIPTPSPNINSWAYINKSSWVLDWDVMMKKWSYYFPDFQILKYEKNIIPVINSYLNIKHLNLYDKLYYHKTPVTFFDFSIGWLKKILKKLISFAKKITNLII